MFFSKKASEKSSPAGVLNLSDAADITEEGTVDFSFKTGEHKHTFQAASLPERDNWIAVLKTKSAAAKDQKESVTGSETYKNSHSSLSKPVMAAAALPKKSSEVKKEEKVEAKEDKKEDKVWIHSSLLLKRICVIYIPYNGFIISLIHESLQLT